MVKLDFQVARQTSDTLVFGLTFTEGMVVEMEFAIVVGVATSLFTFLSKSATPCLRCWRRPWSTPRAPYALPGDVTSRNARKSSCFASRADLFCLD